jgi:hypothetical protein
VGYLPRKLDRDRARRAAREISETALDARPWEATPDRPPSTPCLVRFASRDKHPVSQRGRGIFSAAYAALRDPELPHEVAERLRAELDWFNESLHGPDVEDARAIFFFKSTARACMQHIWSLVHGLRDAGLWIEMQTLRNPGQVVYEDEHQVAVVPWTDKPVL